MKLAVSNIAWPSELNAEVFPLLRAGGVGHLEIAPTKLWPGWEGATVAAARAFRRSLEAEGLSVSSLQSILFQKPELQLFGTPQDRDALFRHLLLCANLAVELGAKCLVFGAPKNRQRRELPESDAFAIAAEFFARVGAVCADRGVFVGFEANPAAYACDFATNSGTAARLVREVGSVGFQLHLDTACLYLAGEFDPLAVIQENRDILGHLHASEPHLGDFSAPVSAHAAVAKALGQIGYNGFVALEMRSGEPPLPALEQALVFLRGTYA